MFVFPKSVKSKKTLPLVIFFGVLILLFLVSSSASNYINGSKVSKFNEIIGAKDYKAMEAFTKSEGISQTYQLLKLKFPNNNPEAHDFAHVIGIAAYQKEKMPGISECDSAFNYGCMHGFMESFLAQNSIKQLPQIENACITLGNLHAPSCLHGIGHGVMIDSGYVLDKALGNCHLLQNSSQLYCFDGVFMERIVQSMQAPEKKFPVTLETLDFPCREVAYIYKSQCWRNQVTSWIIFFRGDTRAAGARCLLVEPEFAQICFESVGLNVAMTAPKSGSDVASLCAFLPGGAVADDCLIGVLKETMFEGKSRELARSLCDYIGPYGKQNCVQLFDGLNQDYKVRFGS